MIKKEPVQDLNRLFSGVSQLTAVQWEPGKVIKTITSDSRSVEPGDLFVACRGARMDGHDFLNQALYAGAAAIVFETFPELTLPQHVTAIQVENSSATLALLLNRYYQYPDHSVKLIGTTGTNGKTTVSYLLQELLKKRAAASYLGTLWYDLPSGRSGALNTTPGSEVLIPHLATMRNQNIQYCVLEVSSHALQQYRVHGLEFELALFTQLTQDHLDYHKNLENYYHAKRKLFCDRPGPRQSLINADCVYGRRLLEEFPESRSYSLQHDADYRARDIECSLKGNSFSFCFNGKAIPVKTWLSMRHNVANAVCVLGAMELLGYDPRVCAADLAEIEGIPGRLQKISPSGDIDVFVDYAHTPDAFENVLSEARRVAPRRVLTAFGCGGDRDRAKRALMAEIASKYSDVVYLTSDNPRSEDPELILKDLYGGCKPHLSRCDVIQVLDREQAIHQVIASADPGDVVLILGKGHEDYQILGDRKIPFDDRTVAREALKRKGRVFSA